MSENIENTKEVKTSTTTNYTVDYILAKLADIHSQTKYLNQSITELSKVRSDGPEDIGAAEKAKALAEVVRCRETTNQQMMEIYEKLLDNILLEPSSAEELKWIAIKKLADVACTNDDYAEQRSEMLESIRQILRENK